MPRASRRRRVIFTGAGVGLAAAAARRDLSSRRLSRRAGPCRAGARQAGHSRQGATFVTAAMIEHVAGASSSALASSGQERISYRSVKNGAVTSAGTDTVSYSGSNYNYATSCTVPYYPVSFIRVVNGQFYLELPTATKELWLHELDQGTKPHFPEAATLLRLLSPDAKFQNAGTNVIGGIRLTHLHATQLGGLPADRPSPGTEPGLRRQVRSRAAGHPDRARPVDRQPRCGAPDDHPTARRRRRDDAHGDLQRLRPAPVHHRPGDLERGPRFLRAMWLNG